VARGPAARGWCVYLLRCRDGSLYAGATNDVAGRLARHAAGKGARYTRSRLPVVLVYRERAADRSTALRREAALKRLRRAEKLDLVARAAARRRRREVARAARPRRPD
jgi:putative endonuclease